MAREERPAPVMITCMRLIDYNMHLRSDHACAGMICVRCSPVQVAEDAIADARGVCLRQYGTAPEVDVYGDTNFSFPYVPSHLHHMMFELVKNSLRAVNDRFEDADFEPPPVRVIIAKGGEDVAIKVSLVP